MMGTFAGVKIRLQIEADSSERQQGSLVPASQLPSFLHIPCRRAVGNTVEKGRTKNGRGRGRRGALGNVSWTWHGCCAHELTGSMVTSWGLSTSHLRVGWGSPRLHPSLRCCWLLLVVGGGKSHFLQWCSHWQAAQTLVNNLPPMFMQAGTSN